MSRPICGAERRLGEMLAEMPKAKGTLKRGPVVPDENRGEVTLADLGIDRKNSPAFSLKVGR